MRESLANFGLNFGTAFQIIDDCLDIFGTEYSAGKTLGTDIAKGKPTLPLLILFDRLPKEKKKVFDEIVKSDSDIRDKRKDIANLAGQYDVQKYSEEVARKFMEDAKRQLDSVEDSLYKESLLLLAEHIIKN
jgi:octaprenyl-diphosphate synthase